MKRDARARKVRPLCHRFEIVDGLAGLDFDQTGELRAAGQDEGWEERAGADLHGNRAVVADVDCRLELSLVLGLKKPDQAVMFELLSNWPDKNGRHSPSRWGDPNIFRAFF